MSTFSRLMPSLLPMITVILGLQANPAWSHVVSEADHHAFEHKYADLCVAREKANPNRVITSDDKPLIALCECIAQEESKHLTSEEVRKFVRENKYPVSLLIKAGQAESLCGTRLQQ
jgi:hypothetical protein